jgi:hypothetical protein
MKITDNGTLVTLGLVGVVAAVGAANQAGFYGSRALGGNYTGFPHGGPSIKRMQDMLRISKDQASALKAMMDGGKKVSIILREADRVLNGNGVEYIDSREDTMRSQDGLSYVNMGDTYDTTLLYDHKTGRFSVGSWGDVVERQPRRFE